MFFLSQIISKFIYSSHHLWWSSKGAWRAPCAAKMDEEMEASWKALASNGRWKRW